MVEALLLELATKLAISTAVRVGVRFAIDFFQGIFARRKLPKTIKTELSDTDIKMAEQTNVLIREHFGEDVCDTVKSMSNVERLQAADRFANDLKELYGLDIDIDVVARDASQCGYFNWRESKAVFNVIELWVENDNPDFESHIQNFFDTIIHELRHAVQHRAISEEGFWNVEEERRQAWENNFNPNNYIRPDVNLRAYMEQPVESDAYTFAAHVMEGAFAK